MNRRALLVEGYTDTLLMKGILYAAHIQNVDVYPPKDLGGPSNGISNIIKLLPVMVAKIQSGDFDSFAVLVDADYTGINGGFVERQRSVEAALLPAGYVRQANGAPQAFGDVFHHATLIPIHVAILPDHASDGMAEDVLVQSVSAGDQSALLTYAQQSIANLPVTLFNRALHSAKAQISTLLAWQKSPGCDSGIAIRSGTFDLNAPALARIAAWLTKAFP